ncbi:HPr family phosphocarrier protein [Alicyclobacillus fastidiosus]|uniref:Phosphocarrier protein HPr n=1 Tax=Alicyclobacillus fastidiosus TaxID=392011 RepID=A0ABY6ZEM0_9BACL|nr:HPr family phosphocarrier protein [Alicyclobacillus fastidiosus]WAH40942.1 HPr family phosphocarrier protein [Alicyclobacillus fastidiosus]GMA62448.1 phosphocarrier protein HPr [Alicyclobacillus fastidiosus]
MQSRVVEVQSEAGLHARPASEFVNTAQRFTANVKLTADGKTVDGKSILGILSLGIAKGTQVEITVDGADEEEALAALAHIVAQS